MDHSRKAKLRFLAIIVKKQLAKVLYFWKGSCNTCGRSKPYSHALPANESLASAHHRGVAKALSNSDKLTEQERLKFSLGMIPTPFKTKTPESSLFDELKASLKTQAHNFVKPVVKIDSDSPDPLPVRFRHKRANTATNPLAIVSSICP